MTASLLAHAEHLAPHAGTEGFIGVALLLIGAGAALWLTRRQDSPRSGHDDDSRGPVHVPSDTNCCRNSPNPGPRDLFRPTARNWWM